MRPEKAVQMAPVEAGFAEAGIPAEWAVVLQKMGFATLVQLRAANPNKLFNDLGGMRKKLKLEQKMPSLDEVKSWLA